MSQKNCIIVVTIGIPHIKIFIISIKIMSIITLPIGVSVFAIRNKYAKIVSPKANIDKISIMINIIIIIYDNIWVCEIFLFFISFIFNQPFIIKVYNNILPQA